MRLVVLEQSTELNDIFGEPDYKIPFLGSSLLEFAAISYGNEAKRLGRELEIFTPSSWGLENPYDNISEVAEGLTIISPLWNILYGTLDADDISYLNQNKGNLYRRGTFFAGFVVSELTEPKETENLFSGVINLTAGNYLNVTQRMLSQVSAAAKKPAGNTFYGEPVNLSENIQGSTICAPSYISPDSVVINSYIAPGSVIRNSIVDNSRVYGSVVAGTKLLDSTVENSVISYSDVSGAKLSKSLLPRGAYLRKVQNVN